jgi:putative tryptophan/tyrosine transport system substrate-binding protein
MRRRDLLKLIPLITLPFAVQAQQAESMRRLFLILLNTETDPVGQARIAALRLGLQELGWSEGRNLQIHYRWGAGDPDRARAFAKEVVTQAPDLVVANGTAALAALHGAPSTIPIVFVGVTDPVRAGYVQSLGRPGGNITGFSTFEPEIGGKWLELLKEIDPNLKRVAGILDPDFGGFAAIWSAIQAMGPMLGLSVNEIEFRQPSDNIEAAIAAFAEEPSGALLVLPTAINNLHRERIIGSAAQLRLPAIYPFALYAASGGLISYGINSTEQFRQSASYVDRILRGEDPADLPVQGPTSFELVINLKTAKSLGIEIPPLLLTRADEVIE